MIETLSWLIQSLSDVPEIDNWLSQRELEILSGMRFAKRRNDWRLGRWTAKQAICAYPMKKGSQLSSLEIRAASDGAPEAFWSGRPADVSISISHSSERSLCAVGPRNLAVGCDLEWVEPREDNLILDYFTAEEISISTQCRESEKDLVVNLIWSAKETTLKILREGLRRDTRSVAVLPDLVGVKNEWHAWTAHCLESSRHFYGWWQTSDGFVYTLASDQPTSFPKELFP